MSIVFAENFQNDTPSTIVRRYPGSVRTAPDAESDMAQAFPLSGRSLLHFGRVPPFTEANNRFEVFLEFANQAEQTPNEEGTLNIFGLMFHGLANKGGITYGGDNLGSFPSAKSLNIIVDRVGPQLNLSVFVDGRYVYSKDDITWVPGTLVGYDVEDPGYISGSLPCYISGIVVAVDTEEKTRIKSAAFTERTLSLVDAGNWGFSDTGFVEDVTKADPSQEEPNVHETANSTLSYSVDGDTSDRFLQVYFGGFSEQGNRALSINEGSVLMPLVEAPGPGKVRLLAGDRLDLAVVDAGGPVNEDGLIFLGESQLISYEDLSTAVDFSEGMLVEDSGWLHFSLDGVSLYAAKTSVRHSVSWDQLYAAGLVYGAEGPGPVPGDTPVDQNKTVEIDGKTYRVRLIRGADTDPGSGTAGYDLPGSQSSEWSRLFAPIVTVVFPSYPGLKLAAYTDDDLGTKSGLAGSSSWCQEAQLGAPNNRSVRGTSGVNYAGWSASSEVQTGFGWRPVLELID